MKHQKSSTSASIQKAVIYCRVSDTKQVKNGSGLDSQEHRCREYALRKGYLVERVFPDDASGGGDFMARKGMVALLDYFDANRDEKYIVIFDDLKRYARDTLFHLKLRGEMYSRNAERECLNFEFQNSPEGEFMETIFAAHGQLERQQGARQTRQKMRARVDKGYYVFGEPPLGYEYKKMDDGGKMLTPSEPNASIVKEALEGIASGRFQTTNEVQRFFEAHPSTITRKNGNPRQWQSVYNVLRSPIYAGYFNVKKWDIFFKKGKHEPLISLETWKKVQAKLDGKVSMPARKDFTNDFPLRGCVECATCHSPMTAAWSKGRTKLYGYYFCQQKDCEDRKRNIRKEKIEAEFEDLLQELQPAENLFQLALAMMEDRWEQVMKSVEVNAKETKRKIAGLENKTAKLVDLLTNTDSSSMIKIYEKQINALEQEKAILRENVTKSMEPKYSFSRTYRTTCEFLSSPWKLWESGNLEYQKLLLRLVFPKRIAYCPNEGYRTAQIAEPVRLFQLIKPQNGVMVGDTGIEPVTPTMSM